MKKKVFSLDKFVEYEKDVDKETILYAIEIWAYDCVGLTGEEMWEQHSCSTMDDWMEEIDVPYVPMFEGTELKVGDCFYCASYFWRIKSIHDDYFMVDKINEYGDIVSKGTAYWFNKDIKELYTPKKKVVKELTLQEIANKFGVDVEELRIKE
jgi:hypothetical protein